MPRKSNKTEYTVLSVLALVTGLVLFWMVWQGLIHEERSGRRGVRTTRSTNVDGTLVSYMLFERLGLSVERSDGMLVSDRLDDADVIFLIDPIVPPHAGELKDLHAWIVRGGVLVTTEMLEPLAPALGELRRERRAPSGPRRTPDHPARIVEDADSLPLARDVAGAYFERDMAFDRGRTGSDASSRRIQPLFADDRGMRIMECSVGRGRLIVLADSSFLANGYVARADNAILAANLVSYALARSKGKRVLFDEYHFGSGGRYQGFQLLARMLFSTSAGWAVLALTAAGILLLIYKGRQFGARRSAGRQRRRSKTEYVYAVGATYRSAGAHRLTLRLLYNGFRQRLMSRAALAASASNRLIAEELARRGRLDAMECQRVLDECDRTLSQASVSQRQFTLTVQQLARLEKEALDGPGNGN